MAEDDSPRATTQTKPSDAFGMLGNDLRTDVLRTLADEEPCSFATLSGQSNADTSAGFAYHLRQLDGQFVRQRDDERYELTTAGREAVRTMKAGTVTERVEHEPIALDEQCPRCREERLQLAVADSVAAVACAGCGAGVLELPVPPGGYRSRRSASIPDAVDGYHRHRIRSFADGVCPDCGGASTGTVKRVESDERRSDGVDNEWPPGEVQLSLECDACGAGLTCPVTASVLDHPAVVSFYRDHGAEVRERPLWNVGPEWRERLVSTDPWCVLVSTRLDDELLELYLSGDGQVRSHRRRPVDDENVDADVTTVEDAETTTPEEGESPADETGVGEASDDAVA